MWSYWDGRGWSASRADVTELVPSPDGVSQTLSVFRRGETWYAFSKRGEFLGTDLVFWTAPSAHGPFTAQQPVGSLPSDAVSGELRYLPLAHPDLLREPGSLLVSYSRNRTDFGEVVADPQLADREMIATLMHPTAGLTRVMGVPVKLSGTPGAVRTPPPTLGQHTEAVLAELEYDREMLMRLKGDGAI